MNPIISKCKIVSEYLDRFCLIGAILLLIINLCTVLLGVFSRFYKPPLWTIDLAQITLVWAVMLGAVPALKRAEHTAINIFADKLPYNFQKFVIFLRTIVFLAIISMLIILGFKYAYGMRFFTIMSLGIKKTIPLMGIPVGMSLMLVQYILLQFIPLENKKNDSCCKNNQNLGS